jgi:hypothetical protein
MFNRSKSKPVVYERDKKVTLVGETDSEGKLFITGYRKEDSTMGQETPKVDIGSAGTLTPPFPSGVEPVVAEPTADVPIAEPTAEVPVAPEPTADVPIAEPTAEVPVAEDTNIVDSNADAVPAPDASVPPPPPSEGSVPPLKPPKPATMAPVSPSFTEKMNQGGRKSRRNKKTGKKQKGGKLRRKSRKQRK